MEEDEVTEEKCDTLLPDDTRKAVKARLLPQIVVSLISGIAPLLIGLTYGYSSPVLPEFEDEGQMDSEEGSWFASLGMLGTVLGALVAVFTVDHLGRKTSLILHGIPSIVGWLLVLMCLHVKWTDQLFSAFMHLGRLLTGIAAGMTVITFPVYIAETSTKHIRGFLIVLFQVSIDFGILMMMVLGIPLSAKWLALAPLVLSVLLTALMFLLPETPRWYLKKARKEEAVKAMTWLRGKHFNTDDELKEIEDNVNREGLAGFSLKDFARKEVYKPMVLAMGLTFFQQGCGITAVVFYQVQICQDAGFSNPDVIAVVTSAVFLLADAPAATLTDRAGRRAFLLSSALFMAISHGMIGLYFYLTEVHIIEGLNPLSLTGLLLFLVAFSLGMGPIVFVVLPEIFPLHVRGSAMGICIVICYAFGFLVTKYFPTLLRSVGNYGTFWMFGGVTLISVIFIAVFIPETKGKSLEEIEEYFRSGPKPMLPVQDSERDENQQIQLEENVA